MTNVNADEFIRNAASQEIGFLTRMMTGGYRVDKIPQQVSRSFPFHTDKGRLDLHLTVCRLKGYQGASDRFEFVVAVSSDKHGWIAEAKQQLFQVSDNALETYAEMSATAAAHMVTSFLQQPEPLPFGKRFKLWLASLWPKVDVRYPSTASA